MAPSIAACISSTEDLQFFLRKGFTSKDSPGWSSMCSVIERADLPKTSVKTSSSLRLDTVRQLRARFFSPTIILVSLKRYRIRSRSWRMSAGGIKLGLTMSHMNRSQIHFASLRSVLLPLRGFVYLGCASTTDTPACSRILKTGIQYLPVDSMQTSLHSYLASQSHSSFNPFVKDEKRACLYSVMLFGPVIPMQA